MLEAYGVPVTADVLVDSAAEAAAAGGLGYPVVMKATGADIAHKTELGLVRLGVDSAAEAQRAYAELVRRPPDPMATACSCARR